MMTESKALLSCCTKRIVHTCVPRSGLRLIWADDLYVHHDRNKVSLELIPFRVSEKVVCQSFIPGGRARSMMTCSWSMQVGAVGRTTIAAGLSILRPCCPRTLKVMKTRQVSGVGWNTECKSW